MAASATFALKADVWFPRGRLLIVSPDSLGTACPLSGRYIFFDVEDLDARDVGRNVEVFLDIRVEGKPTPVTVKLSYQQASDLAILLEPFRKP